MKSSRVITDLAMIPTFITVSSLVAWSGIQQARAEENGPVKTSLNQTFTIIVSLDVALALMNTIIRTCETLGDDTWRHLSTKQKSAYTLLMLLAFSGYVYAGIQDALGHTTTNLWGKCLPAVIAALSSGIANNSASYFKQRNQQPVQLAQQEEPTEATQLRSPTV